MKVADLQEHNRAVLERCYVWAGWVLVLESDDS